MIHFDICFITLWVLSGLGMLFGTRGYVAPVWVGRPYRKALRLRLVSTYACGFISAIGIAWIFG